MDPQFAGDRPWEPPVMLGSWERGERYLNNIIEDLNHWSVGWTDWNLSLDMEVKPGISKVSNKANDV